MSLSRLLTILGCVVSVTSMTAPQIAERHPDASYWLTLAGIVAMALGREIVTGEEVRRFRAKKLAILFVAFFLVSFMSACEGTGQRIVSYCDKGTRTIERLREAQAIDADDASRLLPLIADVRAAGVEYGQVEQTVAQTKEERLSKRARLAAIAQRIITSLRRLDEEGVLHVKNPETRRKLQQGLAVAEIIADFTQ